MLAVDITLDDNAWRHQLHITERQLQTAAIRALNKTARWLRTHVASDTATPLNIPVGLVKAGLVSMRARQSQPIAGVALKKSGATIKASKLGSPQQTQRGVRTGRKHWGKAFVGTQHHSGRQAVFRRRGKARLPIRELSIAVTGIMSDVMERLAEGEAMRQFNKIFEHELRYLTQTPQ
jgi:hypothetical protein